MLELWKDILVHNIVNKFDTVLIKINQFRFFHQQRAITHDGIRPYLLLNL